MINLHHGDCLEVLASMPENSIDAVVTDPPYELGFMGKSWDASGIAFCPDTWRLLWRVMKPGAHLVAFGAPKNYHRLACAIEDAGFEIRDSLMWVFGTGFPKSANVSKQIDKAAGAERDLKRIPYSSQQLNCKDGQNERPWMQKAKEAGYHELPGDDPVTDAAKEWDGWGTALKPAYEPIVLARKPLSEKTVAANVLRWGTGALNIDATRIEKSESTKRPTGSVSLGFSGGWANPNTRNVVGGSEAGRWPANLCHDGSQQVLDLFPHTKSGALKPYTEKHENASSFHFQREKTYTSDADEGYAARFFYSAKASKADRAGSKHPTVKPVSLMQWLVRMVTPPGGTVLDPFAGNGTTGAAAQNEGFKVTLIEREEEYLPDIKRRLNLE
jgi:DNA modification methylase